MTDHPLKYLFFGPLYVLMLAAPAIALCGMIWYFIRRVDREAQRPGFPVTKAGRGSGRRESGRERSGERAVNE